MASLVFKYYFHFLFRMLTGPLFYQKLLMLNLKDVSDHCVVVTVLLEYNILTAHIPDSPGVTESRGFRYVTAGIIFLVVITAIALTVYFVRKAQEEKSKKRFF